MPGEISMSRDAFQFLAAQAGLDTDSPHLDELYPYVQIVLAGLRWLDEIDVDGAEPDLVFIPSHPSPGAN